MNLFSILAISDHCLHQEQLHFFKTVTDDSYNYTAVIANDNPPLLSGKPAHGGVALFRKRSFDSFISSLKNINSDRIVGIRCDFPNSIPLFILGVYLTSASHNITEFNEYLDHLWAFNDSLSVNWFVIVVGNFNGDFGNSLGDKTKHEPYQRGLTLQIILTFALKILWEHAMVQLKHIFLIVADIVPRLITHFCLTFCLKKSFQQKHLVCTWIIFLITSLFNWL